jgi:protein TonB
MANSGFFEQRRASPTGLALIVMSHAAILGALILVKGPGFIRPANPPLVITPIAIPDDPPPTPPTQPDPRPQQQSQIDRPPIVIALPPIGDPVEQDWRPPAFPDTRPPGNDNVPDRPADPPPVPVRIDAQIDPRFAGALQPPYPAAEQRAQRGGMVRIRVTIGADGRVTAAQQLSATSDAFWRATERQALTRWRFRPATIDGRPVEGSKTMTVHFRIDDI